MVMERRAFIKQSCTACMAFAGVSVLSSLLSGCASVAVYKTTVTNNIISVPRSSILPDEHVKIIRAGQLEYDILLVMKRDNSLPTALQMKCTHRDNELVATSGGLMCNLHGSSFNLEGDVTQGPATENLKKFKVAEENNIITIYI